MANLWLKIKIWTKVVIAALIALYVLMFVLKNGDRQAEFWYWIGRDYRGSLLSLVAFSFLIGGLTTILATTTFRTIRQIRELRVRNRSAKLEAEVRDMRAKAAMLQTKPPGGSGAIPVSAIEVIPPDDSGLPPAPPKP
jgi:uncharacterized integral membrane protein